MGYDVHIQAVSAQPLAVVRRRAALAQLPQVIPAACGLVWNAIKAQQIKGAGRHVALYLDDVFNLEIGVELEQPIEDHDPLFASATPAGQVATTVHFGPYPQLHAAHKAIHDWCKTHHHTLAGPSWELYGHWQAAWNTDPSAIRTDIYYLLKASDSADVPR